MTKCPACKNDITQPTKKWKYGRFDTKQYICNKCGTKFNEYSKKGKHSFTLKHEIGKGYVKV